MSGSASPETPIAQLVNTGGANDIETVFKLTPAGHEFVFWSFGNGTDGANPYAGLIMDASGNLYGTTAFGDACKGGPFREAIAIGAIRA
jgi:hypothetical protein